MSPVSVPHLFAMAVGVKCAGSHRCFYCGAPAAENRPVGEHVKSSFNGRSGVIAPGSPCICEGCILCLRESAGIRLIDGETRANQKVRGYSWFITARQALAMTKAHIPMIRSHCLSPPEPPFAIVLTNSGQTHQLYRGVVNHARDSITVSLEAERIAFRPENLAELLPIAGKIAAGLGKPALSEPIPPSRAFTIFERYDGAEVLLDGWNRQWSTGLGRLTAWLTPRKEECERAYPPEVQAC